MVGIVVNMNKRLEELVYFLTPFMEENFDNSREILQDKIVCNSFGIWNHLKNVVHKVLKSADELQKQNRKEASNMYYSVSCNTESAQEYWK